MIHVKLFKNGFIQAEWKLADRSNLRQDYLPGYPELSLEVRYQQDVTWPDPWACTCGWNGQLSDLKKTTLLPDTCPDCGQAKGLKEVEVEA